MIYGIGAVKSYKSYQIYTIINLQIFASNQLTIMHSESFLPKVNLKSSIYDEIKSVSLVTHSPIEEYTSSKDERW